MRAIHSVIMCLLKIFMHTNCLLKYNALINSLLCYTYTTCHSLPLSRPCSVISSDELAAIKERLPEELKGDMEDVFRKRLEFEFHPAGYHVMLATTTGLRTAADHLVKVGTMAHAVTC